MSLTGAISDLQTKALQIPRIRSAPDKIPESMSVFPFAVCYPRVGRLEGQSHGFGLGFHTLVLEIHVNRQILGLAVQQAQSFIEPVFEKIISDPRLNNQISTVTEMRYTFGRLEWAGVETVGIRFEVDVKILQEAST